MSFKITCLISYLATALLSTITMNRKAGTSSYSLQLISRAVCGLMMYFAPATMVPLVYVVNSKLPNISTDYMLFPTASYLALTIHS